MISGTPCPSATWSRSKPLRIPPVLLPPALPSWVPHCGTSQRVSKGKRAGGEACERGAGVCSHTCRGWMPLVMTSEIMRTWALFFGSCGRRRGVGRVSSRYSMMASCLEGSSEARRGHAGPWTKVTGQQAPPRPPQLKPLNPKLPKGGAPFGPPSCKTWLPIGLSLPSPPPNNQPTFLPMTKTYYVPTKG